LTGIGFKLGVVPFHLWTPDVYEGAPAPVTAFVATASKTAMVALLLRFLSPALQYRAVSVVFAVIAIASMCAGNLLALRQTNVKRILAYSSIAHFGYVLVAFQVGTAMGAAAVGFYLVAYSVTTLIGFGIVTMLSDSASDAGDLEDYRGLFWRRPVLAGIFTAALLSLAGIPATMGFLGKFYVLTAGAAAEAWPLMVILVLTSVAGLFYYLRVVVMLYSAPADQAVAVRRLSRASGFVLCGLAAVLLWLGVYPTPLLHLLGVIMSKMA
jgi:NADH-quinone oxidoreductase subunit N